VSELTIVGYRLRPFVHFNVKCLKCPFLCFWITERGASIGRALFGLLNGDLGFSSTGKPTHDRPDRICLKMKEFNQQDKHR
jgi:hypothetical protein